MFKMLKRIVLTVVFLELAYVLILNTALNVSLTQKLIKKIKPEKFQITWEKAWTPYPFKVYIEDGSAWGASSSQQWKVKVHNASASVSLLPLLKHKVNVYDIDAVNVNYFQRPVTVDTKKAGKEAFFVTINNDKHMETTGKTTVVKKKAHKKEKKAWQIELKDIVANGEHSFWIYHAKGNFSGNVKIDHLSIETKGGPFAIHNGTLDILMNSLQIGKEKDVLTQSKIKGSVEFSPIVFSKNKGMKMLSYLSFDTDIRSQMGNLDLLNIYLHRFKTASLKGKGMLDGHIHFHKGKLLSKTDIKINADSLSLSMMDYRIKGNGQIGLSVQSKDPKVLQAKVIFDSLHAYASDKEKGKETLMVEGKGLTLEAKGSPQLVPVPAKKEILRHLALDIPSVKIDDLNTFQRYVPQKWGFKLHGGSGELHAKAALEKTHTSFNVQVLSKEAKVGFSKQTFQSNLDLMLKFDAALGDIFTADMSGSYLSLKDSVITDKAKSSKSWDTRLSIDKSTFTLPLKTDGNTSKEDLSIDNMDVKKLLSTADGTLKVTGNISQLDWLNLLLKNTLNLTFFGKGQIEADLKLKQGFLTQGSSISVIPKNLEVGLLDYAFTGDGMFLFDVTQGGKTPTMKFNLSLSDAEMKRKNEKQAMIEHVNVKLNGEVKDLDLKRPQKDIDLHLQIPSAKIKDITIYNSYIPKNSPFRLSGGKADMQADIQLSTNDAKGYVKLLTKGLTMKVDEQKISARLKMDIKLSGGTPKNMAFNIAGSSIVFDQARVTGNTSSYTTPDWSAQVQLKKANVVWRKPIRLQSETTLQIKDSRPVVAMLDNQKEKHNWLSKLMTIEHIRGTATVNMANNVITFPYAFVKSDKIDIGAKGIISSALREGMFFLRYKHLKLLLKMKNGKKNIDIFHTKKTFDNYKVKTP